MLTLSSRPCTIGSSINTRVEMHGEESVPAMDIPLAAILLDAKELNALLAEEAAHDLLFNDRTGAPSEPVFKRLQPFRLKDKFEDASVTLAVGLQRTLITLENVKLAKLTLEPQIGGLTSLSLSVQCTPKLDKRVTQLFAFLNHDAEVEIATGKRAQVAAKQPELNLGNGAQGGETSPGPDDGDDDEDEAAATTTRKKRRPASISRPPPKRKSLNGHARA